MLKIFASTEPEASAGLFEALGLDLRLFVVQGLAFLLLVALLGKFVYPHLVKAVDDRRAAIEAGLKEAKQSHEALEKAESKVADMLKQARKEADEILARTQQESSVIVADAEDKAKKRAEQIIADARSQLDIDVRKAREVLKKDTVELVALATEKIIDQRLDSVKDAELIRSALEVKS